MRCRFNAGRHRAKLAAGGAGAIHHAAVLVGAEYGGYEASAQVFLRVLRDAMFLFPKGADFLHFKRLSALLRKLLHERLNRRRAEVHCGQRVLAVQKQGCAWQVQTVRKSGSFRGLLAHTPCLGSYGYWLIRAARRILVALQRIQHRPIATVYAHRLSQLLPVPMLALADSPQYAILCLTAASCWRQRNRARALCGLCHQPGPSPQRQLEAAVLQQAKAQLGLDLQAVQTVVEKRATIAATPAAFAAKAGLPHRAAPGLCAATICIPFTHPP